jgi:hypothetical protein
MAGKNQKKKEELEDEFDKIQNQHKNLDVKQYLVDVDEDLPGFGELEVYDYDSDLQTINDESKEIMDELVDLYLGDAPEIKNHPYIVRKKKEDARIYASSFFLERMSEKVLLQILRQIDNGDNGARMYEVLNQTMKEIRENNKDGRQARTEVEKLYKEMRKDLGLNEMVGGNDLDTGGDDEGEIIDTKSLNDKIDNYLKGKDKDE